MTTPSTRCALCGRALWKPETIKLGMGPKCAEKSGNRPAKKFKKINHSNASKAEVLGIPLFGDDL
jgi:hypothetical protein